jgi:ATP-dependent Lon protease
MIKKKKQNDKPTDGPTQGITVITDLFQGTDEAYNVQPDEDVPVLALRNMVMFPHVVLPVNIGRKMSMKAARHAESNNIPIAIVCQIKSDVEKPEYDDLYHIGVMARVLRIFETPGRGTTVLLQSNGPKIKLNSLYNGKQGFLRGQVTEVPEEPADQSSPEFQALADVVRDQIRKYLETMDQFPNSEAPVNLAEMSDVTILTNFFCASMLSSVPERMKLLEINSMYERMLQFLAYLKRDVQLATLKQEIMERTREDLDRQQREYFLQQQIKNIQEELGWGNNADVDTLLKKGETKMWGSQEAHDTFVEEVNKLSRISPNSADYNVQLTYVQTLLKLPWATTSVDPWNVRDAERLLNKDQYGLEKVKERILEYLAVVNLKFMTGSDIKAPILCLYGPPGVGKTSLGRSIANAMCRKYVRISLGGVHDEAEIRGHRRTYIGAMPGRIIKSLIKAGTSNPVIILDEIDKLGESHQGDPASAMLEVLDPEQNSAFHDNYIDMDYDLSKITFIATANNISTIPAPLLDRMELIEVSGYTTEEKVQIAKKHLIPKEKENSGLSKTSVRFSNSALENIIENYTRESGVRELEKKIGKVMRKVALEMSRNESFMPDEGIHSPISIKGEDVEKYLGIAEYSRDKYQGNGYAGVVTGLAWTAVGGEILFVETSLSRGKGGKLTLTGNLGDVMKESAMLALEYLKAHSSLLQLPEDIFENWNIHIHVPEGAIPKDGPSAGITMVTSLASALTQRKVKSNLAMTGEITLRGKVLPVGGIKEKILAAKRAGIKEIILCQDNQKNIHDIPEVYLKGLEFHYVNDIKEVLDLALTQERVKDAIDFTSTTEPKTSQEEKK